MLEILTPPDNEVRRGIAEVLVDFGVEVRNQTAELPDEEAIDHQWTYDAVEAAIGNLDAPKPVMLKMTQTQLWALYESGRDGANVSPGIDTMKEIANRFPEHFPPLADAA